MVLLEATRKQWVKRAKTVDCDGPQGPRCFIFEPQQGPNSQRNPFVAKPVRTHSFQFVDLFGLQSVNGHDLS